MAASSTCDPDELLRLWRAGDGDALRRLLPQVYEELHRVAERHLRRERPGHTLQTTALIHEAYLRLMDQSPAKIHDRCHFVALTSHLMRQILVDHARARIAKKRDGGYRITLAEDLAVAEPQEVDLLAVNEALNRLAGLDPQQARVVELRYFGGLSIPETSAALGISEATVKRDWATARAWLHRQIERSSEP
ncbi:MAG: sigma-70 family RNA polymerase sigma factor [Steroidobacteraceae bacterium]